MPVPEGIISTSTGPAEAVQEVVPVEVEEYSEDQASYDAAIAEVVEDDLPELS
jgi:hypothetical protein